MIKMIIMGNLGQDAQVSAEHAVINFTVAVTEKWMDKNNEKQEKTHWVRCAYWRKDPEKLAKYLTKGTKVLVEGQPSASAYLKDQVTPTGSLDCKVFALHFAGSSAPTGGERTSSNQENTDYPNMDEVPF